MKFNEAIKMIEEIAPVDRSIEWDNSGVQIETGVKDINHILVCLEINTDVIEEAKAMKSDLILTHHPLIFNSLKSISINDYPGRYINECIKNNISVYSAHLSFDFALNGNNYYIARLLDLNVKEEGGMDTGYYGILPEPMTFDSACHHVENSLSLPPHYIKCVDGGKNKLETVGFCTGAGGDYIFEAAGRGCDLFITGDLKLHEAQYAKAVGMSVIDAGHYGTEKIFSENMAQQILKKAIKKGIDIDVTIAEANTNPFTL